MSDDDHTTHIINVGGRIRPEDAERIADAIMVAQRRSSSRLKSEMAPTREAISERLAGGPTKSQGLLRKWYHHLRRVTE